MSLGRAAIITVGTELVEGLRADTNGPEIALRLSRIGWSIEECVSVRDDLDDIAQVVSLLTSTCDLVVSTGGLGPTHDDVTREGVSKALGRALVTDEADAKRLEDMMAGRVVDESMRALILKQALVLEGAELIKPLTGTAPAQVVPTERGTMLMLPGPPNEMRPLLEEYLSRLESLGDESVDIACFGLPETRAQRIVEPLIADVEGIVFTVLASPKDVHVILHDGGCGADSLHRCADAVVEALGDNVFSTDGETLEEVVVHLAQQRGATISSAESCTGGLVAGAITNVAGSSEVFPGSIVSYCDEVKNRVLGVDEKVLAEFSAVSGECAAQMAQGARRVMRTTYGVSTTGIAGPGGAMPGKPVGTVWFGIDGPSGTQTALVTIKGLGRDGIRTYAVSKALDLLRRSLLGLEVK